MRNPKHWSKEVYILSAIVFSICCQAQAEDFSLDYEFPPQPTATLGGSIYGDSVSSVQPAHLKQAPRLGARHLLYYTATISKQRFTFIFAESKGKGKGYDTLIADANGDGVMVNEKRYYVKPNHEISNFYAVHLTLEVDGEKAPYALTVSLDQGAIDDKDTGEKGWFCAASHIGYWKGKFKVEKQAVQLVVSDYNGNGRYDDPNTTTNGRDAKGDIFILDRDSKGNFSWYWDLSPMRQSNVVALGGKFYKMRVHPTGRKVSFTPFSPPLGTLQTDYPNSRIRLINEVADIVLDSKNGIIQVPVGSYSGTTWQVESTGQDGIPWQLQGTMKKSIMIKENETVVLQLLSSPVATVIVDKMARLPPELITIIKTANGDKVFRILRDGEDYAPSIKILDATGKTVSRFQYPDKNNQWASDRLWNRPQGLKGKITAVPDLEALPFKIELKPSVEF